MKTKANKKLQDKSAEASVSINNDSFNFDLWAAEVKPQLLAALQRRSGGLTSDK